MTNQRHRPTLALFVLMVWLLAPRSAAHATECAGANQRTIFAGQLPDIVFTAGVPDKKYVYPIQFNFPAPGTGHTDCHTFMRSNLQGVSIQQSYMIPGEIKTPGNWAAIMSSSAPSVPLKYLRVWGHPDVASGQIAIVYDGAAPPGQGSIDLAVATQELFVDKLYLAKVNVSIVAGTPQPTWFTVTTSAANVSGPSVALDHPLLNDNRSQKLFALHQGGGNWNHPIAVVYDAATKRWRIRNEDATPMPVGLTFFVKVDPTAYRVDTARTQKSHYLVIDDKVANNNPYAVIIVTPTASGTRRMAHPYAVAYVQPHWQVLFTDAAPMPTTTVKGRSPGAAGFFVKVLGAGQYVDDSRSADPTGVLNTTWASNVGIDLVAVKARVSGSEKVLSRFCSTVNTRQPALVTMNQTPLPPPAPVSYNFIQSKYYGVRLSGNVAAVFYEDGAAMPENASFNVWAPYRGDCPPHKSRPEIVR